MTPVRIFGIDPGFQRTGYGIIDVAANHARHVCHGIIHTETGSLGDRLRRIFAGIEEIVARWQPVETAIEKVFMDRNADSALKLGQARGVAVAVCANRGLAISEYSPNQIKQAVVGRGHAEKQQVQHMVRILLCLQDRPPVDAADALAVALCHGHHREGRRRIEAAALAHGVRP
jgi:crossover junction endodeoxyribonuclease RuvC